jgi:glutaredoxin domain-containing cysteine-rich protein 1
MILKALKARILRALSSVPDKSADPPSPTKRGALGAAVSVPHGDASFFDAREAEPLDAWELVAPDDGEPLQGFPARRPPGGVVLYTTTLRGVRRTFEDCNGVRAALERLGAAFRERDVSMDRGLRDELWALAGDGAVPPRLFVRGRDLGGAAQVLALHEDGRLASLLADETTRQPQPRRRDAAAERGTSKCGACGGLGFVVCGECDGSRKVFDGARAARCRGCNENGLVMCPLCL